MPRLTFEWDPRKATRNFARHGVSFKEALTVFSDPLARIHTDPDHSHEETREVIVGHSVKRRLMLVTFTERPSGIRIISARRTTRSEHRDYEEGCET